MTLKNFVKEFPLTSFTRSTNNIPDNFNELTPTEKYKVLHNYRINQDSVVILKVESDHIFYGKKTKLIKRVGNRFFVKYNDKFDEYIWIEYNKINVNCSDVDFILQFLNLCNINWHRDIPSSVLFFFRKPTVLRAILTQKIYNEETLYKFIGKRIFQVNIGWRFVRMYLQSNCGISLFDLRDYTRNLEKSILCICNRNSVREYCDLITYAIQLNQIVDFGWSKNRIRQEHRKQIELVLQTEIDEKEEIPIYKKAIIDKNIKQLNTEKEVFLEGKNMHHCLYDCYFSNMLKHKYIAFHMSFPENCTFSVKKEDGLPVFDQIHLAHNHPVQESTIQVAKTFIEQHINEIVACLNEEVDKEIKHQNNILEEIPW